MSSAAGWYVGEVCKDPDCGGMIVPFDRLSGYFSTSEEAANVLDSCSKGISTLYILFGATFGIIIGILTFNFYDKKLYYFKFFNKS